MDAATPPIFSKPAVAYHCNFSAATTDNIGLLRELDALLTLENYNGFTLQATPHAYKNARRFLESASNILVFPKPELTPDGEGGIDIEWDNQGRRLALSCRAIPSQADFISWRDAGGRYDGREASEELLKDRLDWLTR